jgi:hypothetical protein
MRKEQVLGMFKEMGKRKMILDNNFQVALEESKKISNQLKNAKRSGEMCRKKAVWIGVMRYVCCMSPHMCCLFLKMVIGRARNKSTNGWVKAWLRKRNR